MPGPGRVIVWLMVALLSLPGLAMLGGGWVLLRAGGSPYYLAAGAALVAAGVTLALGRASSARIYGLLLLATLGWGLWESGLDAWALAPRLLLLTALGALFLLPPLRRACRNCSAWWVGVPVVLCLAVQAAALARLWSPPGGLSSTRTLATAPAGAGEWPHWGRTLGGDRYSPLGQLHTGNVAELELAWHYHSDVPPFDSFGSHSFETTPLAADDRLYLCVDRNVLVALDQESGRELWRFDPRIDLDGVFVTTCRGVARYVAPPDAADCPVRILYGTADGRLLAVDAASGRACPSFGEGGAVDMRAGMGTIPPGALAVTSPPTVVNGVVVIGQFVSDYLSFFDTPSGVIRGYDALTGELRWAWDAGRPDARGLPPAGESYTGDTPNSWTVFSADPELGLVYIPTGNSPPDYYGLYRSAASERYSSSIVALDTASGTVRWSFQTTHHDLWDYDVPAQPVLLDLEQGGRPVPALVAPTKRGQLFVLDRRDGTPLDPVVERPVPGNGMPGEPVAPTQPYTTGFPSLAGPRLREADMWGMSPLDQLWCRVRFRQVRYAGDFNPPGTDVSLNYPGAAGGSNWGSVSVDPGRGLLVASSLHMAETGQMVPREQLAGRDTGGARDTLLYPQERVPWMFRRRVFLSPLGVPCQQPPYGRISVFAIGSRELLWSAPLGTAEHSGPWGVELGLPIPMGVPNSGGAITTAGGLVFIGAAQDRRLRAFDTGNGRELWSARLPAIGAATPMTYVSAESGRQFVVIAAGGHPGIPGPTASDVLAFALPDAGVPAQN